jgi:uncharacterized protein YndB with AHSA1/START domain
MHLKKGSTMVTFEHSATISAPIEKVFAYVSDPKKIPEWRKDVPEISQISGETVVGSTFVEGVNFMGRKQLHMKVVEFVPNKKIVIQAVSGMSLLPTQSFSFQSQGNKTQVQLKVEMQISGLFKLMAFALPKQLKKIWAGYFENLSQLLAN